jgi:radical SAM superfamily enzyme YgiQ (UPF0313 family)
VQRRIDALTIVAFEPTPATLFDPDVRRTAGAHFVLPIGSALEEVEGHLGRDINFFEPRIRASFSAVSLEVPRPRSLGGIVLATALERAGLNWYVLDPGAKELGWYRSKFDELQGVEPAVVGLSTTFVTTLPWLRMLVGLARRAFPRSKLVVGGSYYATNTEGFLSLDADVFFVGEGEVRFPQLVRALRDGDSPDRIAGLYVRQPNGQLSFTGSPEPIDLSQHCRPDWTLSGRMDPPLDVDEDMMELGVETQRGCVFKCEFCTYRTLSPSPSIVDPDVAVDAIMATSAVRRAVVYLADATATFPPRRWTTLLERLIERGGAPHPTHAFARVSDINDENMRMMRRANIRAVYIGQEAGDQRMLDLMRKGTRASQVAPAVRAAARHDVGLTMGFIHGFPGEDAESLAATRRMLATINDADPLRPPVLVYNVVPFSLEDFASASLDESIRTEGTHHYLGYTSGEFDIERISRECLRTMIETSRVPHAPVSQMFIKRGRRSMGIEFFTHPKRHEVFRWLKALDRMLMIFVDHRVFGTPPSRTELSDLRRQILMPMQEANRLQIASQTAKRRVRASAINVLRYEWAREASHDVGPLTRALMAGAVLRDTRSVKDTMSALRSGIYGSENTVVRRLPELAPLARELITDATTRARSSKLPIVSRG